MIRAAVLSATTLLTLLVGPVPAQVRLQFQFPEGRTLTYEGTVQFDQTLTIQGQAIPTTSKQVSVATSRVGVPRTDGLIPITQTLDSIRAELSLPGGIELTVDSDSPQKPEGEPPQLAAIREIIQAFDGVSYTILLNPDGTVAGVEGVEEAIPADLDPQVAAAVRQRLNPEILKREYQQEYGVFPDEPVSPGQSWTRSDVLNIGGGQTLTFERTYTYEGTVERGGRTLDRITITAGSVSYAMNSPEVPLQVKSSDLKVVSSQGEMLFDREAGQVVEIRNVTRITGSLVLDANGQDLPAELDLSLTTSTALQSSP